MNITMVTQVRHARRRRAREMLERFGMPFKQEEAAAGKA